MSIQEKDGETIEALRIELEALKERVRGLEFDLAEKKTSPEEKLAEQIKANLGFMPQGHEIEIANLEDQDWRLQYTDRDGDSASRFTVTAVNGGDTWIKILIAPEDHGPNGHIEAARKILKHVLSIVGEHGTGGAA